MDQLSGMDASFLHLETPETPMHVGSLMLFELPQGYQGDYYEDVKAMLGKRLHLASVLCRKLAQMPFELAEPVWIEDDDIDLDYHVRSVTLRRPGTMAQLEQLIARLHSTLLDRSRPLWEMYVIEGLENGQVAFYSKAHHSGVDGKAGVELAKVLYDVSPQMREVPPPRRKRGSVSYQLGVTELLQAAVANSAQQYRKLADLLPTAAKALTAAATVVASQRTAGGGRSLNLGLAPRTIFNESITNQRSYTTLSLPLTDIKELGKRVGGTVNTIVMALCSVALDRFLRERDLLPKEPLIAVVPVSLRAEGDSAMNNQVSMVRVDLATDIKELPARFKAIHASSEAAKAVVRELKPVLGVNVPITGSPWLMTGLASLLGRSNFASRAPAAGNVLISNVPGPPMPLYMAGARMVHYHPVSIPYHGSALNITVQSYAGLLEFGLTACRRVLSQDESYELVEHLRAALREIEALPPVGQVEGGASASVQSEPDKAPKRSQKMPVSKFDIVVYGATGFTGRLVAEYLAARYKGDGHLKWAMAGRSKEKLASVRDAIGAPADTPLIVADASDPASLKAMVSQARSVISTVGPYQLHGSELLAACVAAGTDYFDLCGEPLWMRKMIDAHEAGAKASGARIMFSCGFDSIPFELGVLSVQEEAKKVFGAPASRVKGRVRAMKGTLSGGTAASGRATFEAVAKDPGLVAMLKNPFALTPGFEGPKQPPGSEPVFEEDLDSWTAPFMMATINTRNVHRANMLMGFPYGKEFVYDEMVLTGAGEKGEANAKLVMAANTATAGPNAPKPGEGPSKEERESGFYDLLFVAYGPDGQQVRAAVKGDRDPGYGSTSKMIAEAAICLLRDRPDVPAGIWTPGAAMGRGLIARLADHAGLTFAVEKQSRLKPRAKRASKATAAAPPEASSRSG